MGGDEIHGNFIFGAVSNEGIRPCRLRSRGPSYAQARAYLLKSKRSVIVKLPVGRLFRIARPEINIRLVPDFKIPLRNLVDAVPIHQMLCELGDEIVPLVPVFGWGDILLVPKWMQGVFVRRQLLWHKTQLDKRAHTVGQQAIVDLINVGEVVHRMPLGVLVINSDFIMEDGMEAHVLETGDLFYVAEIVAITLAQSQDGAAGAEHLLPEMGKRMSRGGGIDDHYARIRRVARDLSRSPTR